MMINNIMSRVQPEKTKEMHSLLKCVSSFLQLITFVLFKMFAFGQLQSVMENDLTTFLHNLLIIPISDRKPVDTSSFSAEQIEQFVNSQAIRYVEPCVLWVIIYFVKANRFLWPTLLYILIATFFLKCFSIHFFDYRVRRQASLLKTKTKL